MTLAARIAFLLLIVFVLITGSLSATTYYISAAGSDSNNGTSKSTPWLHAPGMTGCSGVCASTTPAAGDKFIFRGGDTWHTSAGAPIGVPWNWKWSGTSASPIYVGVDQTWYNGTSWSRPVIDRDNPLSTSHVSSCAHDDGNLTSVTLGGNYVTFDNFEFTGKCWTGSPSGTDISPTGTFLTISNNYFHGWTSTATSIDSHYAIYHPTVSATHNVISANVFDGSDSFHGTNATACDPQKVGRSSPCQSGFAIYFDAYDVHYNVFRYLSNGIIGTNIFSMHDNIFEYMWNSYDNQTHPNVVESSGNLSNTEFYFYNNVIRHNMQAVNYWPMFDKNGYQFNNVVYDNPYAPGNCFMQSPVSSSSATVSYIFNNTFDTNCLVNFYPGNAATPAWNGKPAYFQNNHYIGYSAFSSTYAGNAAVNNNGGHVFQTESVANGQGYMPANDYAPTSASDATVGMGVSAASWCNAMSDATASAACKNGVAILGYDSVNHAVVMPAASAARSAGSWDVGAYQFGQAVGAVNPPSGLTATVH